MAIMGLICIIAANILMLWLEVIICAAVAVDTATIWFSAAIAAVTTIASVTAIILAVKQNNAKHYSIDLC